MAHYYVDGDLQMIAEETGGYVSDSLDMARFGNQHPATTLVVAGVRFMGETAKILNPEKRVLMPTLEAECSLDLGCPADEFRRFCDAHPDRTVVVYANTSAEVKARADWVVTSSIAVKVAEHLHAKGEKILWAPDRYLGAYVQKVTGADMLLWQGSCVVHEAFKASELERTKARHPDAAVLVHPESPAPVIELADVVGSTTQLIKAAQELPERHLHRRHRPRHFLQDEAGSARQDFHRSAQRRRRRHLPQLRPLPLDGHESPGEPGAGIGNRRQRNPRRRGTCGARRCAPRSACWISPQRSNSRCSAKATAERRGSQRASTTHIRS